MLLRRLSPAQKDVAAMTEASTTQLQGLIDRLNAAHPAARDDLIRHSYERLRRLTHRMLQGFPGVRAWEETDDVHHKAQVRLLRALEAVTPGSVREFFGLAAAQVRRELLDLARHYFGPEGAGAHCVPHPADDSSENSPRPAYEVQDGTHDPGRLAVWTEVHERAGALPEEEREVFDLLWYQGLTQAEAAEVLRVAEVTVRRRWLAARLRLQELLKGATPTG
jgi:RNA polymerase sigma-70 factor (ECF subfamily)